MDQAIHNRLKTYEEEKIASPAVVAFVHAILLWLEETSQHLCTEDTAGPFASHLMLALTRVQNGEALENAWDQGVHEEAEKLHILDPWATFIQGQTQQKLALNLPPEEIDFILLHLGTFLMHYQDPLVSHIIA